MQARCPSSSRPIPACWSHPAMRARWRMACARSTTATPSDWAAKRGYGPKASTTGRRRCADYSSSTAARWFRVRCARPVMRHPESRDPCVAIALHGVCAAPLSLLVVPDYHFKAPVLADRAFRNAMDARVERGDELVLHGMHHVDTEPPPRTLRGYIERRLLTRAEGEFAALPVEAAAARLAHGIDLFKTLGWPLHGFVPPAWLASEASRTALTRCGHPFTYMTVRSGIFRLPDWRFERTANLCYSPD